MAFNPGNWLRSFFKTFSVMTSAAFFLAAAAGAFMLYHITQGLPEVSTLKTYRSSNSTEVFSDDGKKIGEFTTERRYPVQFERIPKHVINAFLAAEDAKFYEHHGIDIVGVFRAAFANIFRGKYAQGGSTITQQLARGLLLGNKKKEITRKIREMILAWRMEKELSKNEILNLYLTEIYLGHGSFGIGAAARNYFHKRVEDLDVAEGAMLAALPQRPNDWDPFHNPYRTKERQGYVLKRMVDERFIRPQEGRAAYAEPLRLYALEDLNNTVAPYFTEYVRSRVMSKYGADAILRDGFKIYTTVRSDFQRAAEKAVDHGTRAVDKRLGWRGVTQHLDSPLQILNELNQIHEEVLDNLTSVRILPATLDSKERKLAYDPSTFQDKRGSYYGPTPIREGQIYKAVVLEANDAKAVGRVGQTSVLITMATMGWVKINRAPARRMSDVLSTGDVIEVLIDKIDREAGVVHASLEQEPEVQGSLLSYDVQTGFVRAMIGGDDFSKNKFNIALQAKRQVGSTFKPILYAAAMDKGYSPSSIVTDAPIIFKQEGALDADSQGESWRPHNYGGKFVGDIPLRLALIHSMNVPTVKLLNAIGIDYGIQYARNLGINAVLPRDLSIALGSWSSSLEELTRAYAVFPRLGRPVNLVYIKKIVDVDGKVLEEYPETAPNQAASPPPSPHPMWVQGSSGSALPPGLVISPQTAYVMIDMLKGVVREGTGAAVSGVPAAIAGKTGTSNDHKDTWFIGFTPQLMTGVWVGYLRDKPLDAAETGGRAAAPIWADYMQSVVHAFPRVEFPIPDDIVFAYVDKETGRLASPQTAKRVRVAFKIGTVPNLAGDNLPRVAEPGSTTMRVNATTSSQAEAGQPAHAAPPVQPPPAEETSDFLREGYQD